MFHNQKIKILFFSLALAAFGWLLAMPAAAQFDCNSSKPTSFLSQFNITLSNGTKINTVQGLPVLCTPQQALGNIIQLLLEFAALVAVVFIILGGFWYLTAAGNEEQSEKGRKAITSAIIGLVVIIMAYALVRITVDLLTNGLTGGSIGNGTTPATNNTNPSGANPANNNPISGSGTSGDPVTPDAGNILNNLTQQEYASYDNQDDLSGSVTFSKISSSGFTAVSTVSASDSQALGNIMHVCGAARPPNIGLLVNGVNSDLQAPYQNQGSGTWAATLTYNGAVTAGNKFQIAICGHSLLGPSANYTPPR